MRRRKVADLARPAAEAAHTAVLDSEVAGGGTPAAGAAADRRAAAAGVAAAVRMGSAGEEPADEAVDADAVAVRRDAAGFAAAEAARMAAAAAGCWTGTAEAVRSSPT